MAQVGATSFALMFAAIQFRWRDWAGTRLGKLAATTALLELLTVTVVCVAFYANVSVVGFSLWQLVAAGCFILGYALTFMYLQELRRARILGYLPTPADDFQRGWSFAPFLAYGVLLATVVVSRLDGSWWDQREHGQPGLLRWVAETSVTVLHLPNWQAWLAGVLVWFLISGLIEVIVSLSPNMLEPELNRYTGSVRIPAVHNAMDDDTHDTDGDPDHPRFVIAARFRPKRSRQPRVAVVLLPEIWGVTPDTLALADRLAGRGHVVLVVDYYQGRRSGLKVLKACRHASTSASRLARMASVARWWLAERGYNEVAVVGLSVGATAALTQTEGWAAVVAFYPEQPEHFALPENPPRTLILVAGRDHDKPRSDAHVVHQAIGSSSELHEYPQARHSFMGTGRSMPAIIRPFLWRRYGPDPLAAQDAFSRLTKLLDEVTREVRPPAGGRCKDTNTAPIPVPAGKDETASTPEPELIAGPGSQQRDGSGPDG
jgi:dienelactone hydrolase